LADQADLGRPVLRTKIFFFRFFRNWWLLAWSRLGKRGVRVVTNVGRDAMDAGDVDATSGMAADGEIVWSWRSDAGAQVREDALRVSRTTVATKHGHRGDHV
jgi:hypothetical protein